MAFGAILGQTPVCGTEIDATLISTNWTGSNPWTQTLTVEGVSSLSKCIVGFSNEENNSNFVIGQQSNIRATTLGDNTITFVALNSKPSVDLKITILLF